MQRRDRHASRLARASRALLACATSGMLFASPSSVADSISEQELKAAMLFRAAKFIDWPKSAFADSASPFVLCLVGDQQALDPFESIQNKPIDAHPVNVRQVTGDMLDLRQCHIAYFSTMSTADVDYALGKFAGMPVLTVGETDAFAERGGMFALVTRAQRVQFTINLPATKRAGLVVSSQLLQLATVIGEARR